MIYGFLESGKTQFINFTLNQDYFYSEKSAIAMIMTIIITTTTKNIITIMRTEKSAIAMIMSIITIMQMMYLQAGEQRQEMHLQRINSKQFLINLSRNPKERFCVQRES